MRLASFLVVLFGSLFLPSTLEARVQAPKVPIKYRKSLPQYGIAWTFKRPALSGQFVNGDWWVVGPVEITNIFPGSTRHANGRITDGSMLNPSPTLGISQGYDSEMYGQYQTATSYQDALNVGLDVSRSNPLVLQPHNSLVTTISDPAPGARPQLRGAAVLTVLDAVPTSRSFRPPYSGNDKTIRHRLKDLDRSKLQNLAPVARAAPVTTAERVLQRPWIDHVPTWMSTYIHPSRNMPDYGRDMADYVGIGSLILNLNLPRSVTDTLLVNLVQVGIDFFGVLEDGGQQNWQSGGGHHSGRKWAILFAGLLLNDPAMSSIGLDPSLLFMGEDGQTFFVAETSPGVYNYGMGGYTASEVGLAEWGNKHAIDPRFDDANWFADPYRRCCTANCWTAIVLAARMMGAEALWNHPPFFAYQDRYVTMEKSLGGSISTSFFSLDMWNTYRAQF